MFGVPFVAGSAAEGIGDTYHNGYGYRLLSICSATMHRAPEEYDPFIFYFRLSRSTLKTVANGGKVESSSGFDLRFELPNKTKLPHVILSYDGVNGEVRARVRSKLTPNTAFQMFLYYGKAGLTVSEADPVACMAGHRSFIDMATGIDHTGNGLDLTLENVTATSINVTPAGDFTQ